MPVRTSPTVRILLIVQIATFVVQLLGDTFFGTHILQTFGLVPYQVFEKHAYWKFFTYAFMHADMFHILFNCLILWMIGSELEGLWGAKFFLKYYTVCALSAGAFYLVVQVFFRGTVYQYVPLVGSSGAVYGLLTAYGILYSERTLLFMMVFPMKAKHFVMLLAAIEFVSTVFYSHSGIANAAHLGGMIVGFGFLFLKAYLRIRAKEGKKTKPKKKKKPKHLRLVVNNELLREFDSDDDDEESSDPGRPTFH